MISTNNVISLVLWQCNLLLVFTSVSCDSSDSGKQSHGVSSSSSPHPSQYLSTGEAGDSPDAIRQSKAVDVDEWQWSRRWANRPPAHRRPPPYDSFYSMYPSAPAGGDRSFHYSGRSHKPLRRTSMSMSAPISAPSSSSYASSDSIQGVFAKWNPKINLTWPPTMAFSSTNDYPDYAPSASYHHHHEDDHHYKQIQFIPIHMPCHHDHKKKEVSLLWPLLFLGLLFLPLLLGALLLPLAFLFITNLIQLLNLLQRVPGTTTPTAGRRRRRRHVQHHPIVDEKIQFITRRLEDSLLNFIHSFSEDSKSK